MEKSDFEVLKLTSSAARICDGMSISRRLVYRAFSTESYWVTAMENKRFLLGVLGIFVITVAAGWIHGLPNRYASWKQVASEAPCSTFEKDGHDVKVKGPLVVDGRGTAEHPIIADEETIKIIDDRCHLKGAFVG